MREGRGRGEGEKTEEEGRGREGGRGGGEERGGGRERKGGRRGVEGRGIIQREIESKEHTTTYMYILSHTSTQTRVVQFPFHSFLPMGWTVGYRHEGWYSLGCSLVHWGT